MGGAAQQDELLDEAYEGLQATGTDGGALRQVASERLAEHRRRRAEADLQKQMMEEQAAAMQTQKRGGASRVREAVAARYQSSVSYHEFLAQEAERALQQAQAEAEVAARNAQAVAEAQIQLLEQLQQWKAKEAEPVAGAPVGPEAVQARGNFASAMADIVEAATEAMHLKPRIEMAAASEASTTGLTVRLYEELGTPAAVANRLSLRHGAAHEEDASELDEEIAFRLSPEFEDMPAPEPVTVSGNVIEFPRQLVAQKKARPRIAEGPLMEPQLRIFEVEPEQVKTAVVEASGAPEWQSILLESATVAEPRATSSEQPQYALQPQTAPAQLRLMAVAVDLCAVAAAFIGFLAVVAELGGPYLRAMPLPLAGATAAVVLGLLFVAYQLLFFTFSEATPGMRYARIALCTFGDANPSRKALRRRVLATLVAACPLGLGLVWAWMDEDGLGWHDRISRMYQRAY